MYEIGKKKRHDVDYRDQVSGNSDPYIHQKGKKRQVKENREILTLQLQSDQWSQRIRGSLLLYSVTFGL